MSTENVISMQAFRTLKECQRLFTSYKGRLEKMEKTELLLELEKYRQEAGRYPNHLLTIVKGEIIMRAVRDASLTEEMRIFAKTEEHRLKVEMYRRLHEEWTQKARSS